MMKVIFRKMFDRHWFVFPACLVWDGYLIEYFPPAKRLELHFLWWHLAWTFHGKAKMKGGAEG